MSAFIQKTQETFLTSTPGSLVPPAPRTIGQALNVGGANTMVPRIAGEYDFSSVLVVGTIDDSPLAMVQREGAETGTYVDCANNERERERKRTEEEVQWGMDIVHFGLFKLTDFNLFSHSINMAHS